MTGIEMQPTLWKSSEAYSIKNKAQDYPFFKAHLWCWHFHYMYWRCHLKVFEISAEPFLDKNIIRRVTPLLSHSLLCTLKHKPSLTSTSVQRKLQYLIFLQKYKTTSLFQVWGHLLQVFVMRTVHACLPDFAICRSYQQRSVVALITQNLDSLLWRCDSFPSFFCSISIKLRQSHYCSVCFWRTVCDCVSAQTVSQDKCPEEWYNEYWMFFFYNVKYFPKSIYHHHREKICADYLTKVIISKYARWCTDESFGPVCQMIHQQ